MFIKVLTGGILHVAPAIGVWLGEWWHVLYIPLTVSFLNLHIVLFVELAAVDTFSSFFWHQKEQSMQRLCARKRCKRTVMLLITRLCTKYLFIKLPLLCVKQKRNSSCFFYMHKGHHNIQIKTSARLSRQRIHKQRTGRSHHPPAKF